MHRPLRPRTGPVSPSGAPTAVTHEVTVDGTGVVEIESHDRDAVVVQLEVR